MTTSRDGEVIRIMTRKAMAEQPILMSKVCDPEDWSYDPIAHMLKETKTPDEPIVVDAK